MKDFWFVLFLFLLIFLFLFWKYKEVRVRKLIIKTVESMDQCIFFFDLCGKCIYVNSYTFQLFHRPQKEVIHDAEEIFKEWLCENHGAKEYAEKDFALHLQGATCVMQAKIQKVTNEKNKMHGYLVRVDDQTKEMMMHQKEQYLASHDALTKTQKREVFYAAAREMMRRNPQMKWNIISTDITNFKLINDLFGEKTGDQVLIKQAAFWKQLENEYTLVGRISSDRFAILMPREEFEERFFLEQMEELQVIDGIRNFKLHITMGVYEVESIFENVSTMCDKAFLANASIDDNFQEHIAYYDKAMLEQLLHEKKMLNDFDNSIEKEKFCMYFQPQVDAKGKLIGAEALVRWKHPELGLLYPDQFVKIYERAGLIYELDQYVWELAAVRLKEWKEKGQDDLCISVNISAKDFYYADVYVVLTNLVRQYQIEPANLNLEITESAVLNKPEHLHIIQKLRNYGFRIEIDDFGSGYSSLHLLTDMKADILKIDMLFLSKTEYRQRSRDILQSVISMAKKLDMKVIAEGVEDNEQYMQLIHDGCDYFQGYYFGEPVSVEEFEKKYHI